MKNFEIHDLTTNEILSNNLEFDDVPELFQAYVDFYPSHSLVFCERITEEVAVPIFAHKSYSYKIDFQEQWLMLVNTELCNFY